LLIEGIVLHQSKYAKRREIMKRVTLVAVCLLFISAIAAAADDTPPVEIFGGYSYFHCDMQDPSISCNLNGWNASGAFNANKYFGIVADFGGVYGKVNDTYYGDMDVQAHSFLFGPKLSLRKGRIAPFAQALFGVARIRESVPGVGSSIENDFAMALGGGLDINAGKNMAIRVAQVEYVQTQSNSLASNNFKVSTGIVFKLGNR
jgi:opacity protein-like surface antigen